MGQAACNHYDHETLNLNQMKSKDMSNDKLQDEGTGRHQSTLSTLSKNYSYRKQADRAGMDSSDKGREADGKVLKVGDF